MNKHTISKSDFLKFYECSSYFWFYKNRKEVLSEKQVDPFAERLIEQGQQVEVKVRELFAEGKMVHTFQAEAIADTKKLLKEGATTIFQASFEHDGLYIMCDVLIWNELFGGWDLYEVKSSSATDTTSKKEHHLIDATFQKIVLDASGHKVVNVYLIELNKEFVKDGEIDLDKLFIQSEITTEVLDREKLILADIKHAKNILEAEQPSSCECRYKGRSRHCSAFNYLYPATPSYSVYDLTAIGSSKKKLELLVDEGILDIKDIRNDHDLSEKHKNQWRVYVDDEVILEKEILKEELEI